LAVGKNAKKEKQGEGRRAQESGKTAGGGPDRKLVERKASRRGTGILAFYLGEELEGLEKGKGEERTEREGFSQRSLETLTSSTAVNTKSLYSTGDMQDRRKKEKKNLSQTQTPRGRRGRGGEQIAGSADKRYDEAPGPKTGCHRAKSSRGKSGREGGEGMHTKEGGKRRGRRHRTKPEQKRNLTG